MAKKSSLSVDTIIKAVLNFEPSHGQKLSPALLGRTGSGKTTRYVNISEEDRRIQFRLLLGTHMAEDVCGIPKVVERGQVYVTTYSDPEWFEKAMQVPEGVDILFDEVDKARMEVVATILTLLAERRMHDRTLPVGTRFFVAGQPVPDGWQNDETAKAFTARLVWIPVPEEWGYLEDKYSLDLEFIPRQAPPKPPILEVPSMRQMEYAIQFVREHTRSVSEAVLSGIMGAEYIKGLLESHNVKSKVKELTGIEAFLALDKSKDVHKYLENLSSAESAILGGEVIVHPQGKLNHWTCALVRGMTTGDQELREKLFQHQYDLISAKAGKADTVEVLMTGQEDGSETTSDHFARAIDLAAAWIIAILEKLNTFEQAVAGIYKDKMPDLSSLTKSES